ncbi:MAG: hypothetical protein MZV65_29725 [Chromatiales bacterium]|nr:hypothetical protein [Chromatiales bacterium]
MANTYYLGGMVNDSDGAEQQAAAKVAVFWPDARGPPACTSTSAAPASPPHATQPRPRRQAAGIPGQRRGRSAGMPKRTTNIRSRPAIPPSATLESWGEFKADTLNVAKLGELNAAAVQAHGSGGVEVDRRLTAPNDRRHASGTRLRCMEGQR